MEFMSQIPLNMALVQDVILLFVSGLACVYCILLNRRLKGLNNLKSGVGASIVSLTEAIHNTNNAAQKAQASTVESVKMLRGLIEKAETLSTQLEAVTIDAERRLKPARSLDAALEEKITTTLPNSVMKAQTTASNLLKVVTDIERYRDDLIGKPSSNVVSIDAPRLAAETEQNKVQQVDLVHKQAQPNNDADTVVPDTPLSPIQTSADTQSEMLTPEMAKNSMQELFDEMEDLAEKAGIKKSGLLSRLKQARA
ncbi:hypothetical protein LIHA111178_02580 [Litorimonas haliclonae]